MALHDSHDRKGRQLKRETPACCDAEQDARTGTGSRMQGVLRIVYFCVAHQVPTPLACTGCNRVGGRRCTRPTSPLWGEAVRRCSHAILVNCGPHALCTAYETGATHACLPDSDSGGPSIASKVNEAPSSIPQLQPHCCSTRECPGADRPDTAVFPKTRQFCRRCNTLGARRGRSNHPKRFDIPHPRRIPTLSGERGVEDRGDCYRAPGRRSSQRTRLTLSR